MCKSLAFSSITVLSNLSINGVPPATFTPFQVAPFLNFPLAISHSFTRDLTIPPPPSGEMAGVRGPCSLPARIGILTNHSDLYRKETPRLLPELFRLYPHNQSLGTKKKKSRHPAIYNRNAVIYTYEHINAMLN